MTYFHKQNIIELFYFYQEDYTTQSLSHWFPLSITGGGKPEESFGQLVVLGFDVTVFTPTPYQRHRL